MLLPRKKQMDPKIDGLEQGKFIQLIYKQSNTF